MEIKMNNVKISPEFFRILTGGYSYSAATAKQTFEFIFSDIELIKDKSEKIRKLEAPMNDPASSVGEKENAKRIIEKLRERA